MKLSEKLQRKRDLQNARKRKQRAEVREWLMRFHGIKDGDAFVKKMYREWLAENGA